MPRPRLTPAAFRRIALASVVAQCWIIVTGASVRLSGSGLGCTDWPNCTEGKLVAPLELHPMIEFVNRVITGFVTLAVIFAVLGSLWRVPRRRDLVWLSLGLVGGLVGQIVVGGLSVLADLAPPFVMAHFLLSLVLVWNALVLWRRSGVPDGAALAPRVDGRLVTASRALVAMAAVVAGAGTVVTATGPHGGDEEARRFGFDISTVARLHAITVIVFLGLSVVLVATLRRRGAPGSVVHAGEALLTVSVCQGIVGYMQYFTDVPALLVGVHVAGAVAVWLAALWLSLSLHGPAPAPERAARAGDPAVAAR